MFSRGLIVEDLPEAASWLTDTLTQAFPGIVIDVAGTRYAALDLLRGRRYDIALIDLGLPDGSGLDLISVARALNPPVYTVVSTVFDDDDHIFPALRLGAQGYLLKDSPKAELVSSLQAVVRGCPPLSPHIASAVLAYFSDKEAVRTRLIDDLTQRERDVLSAIAGGLTVTEAAQKLGITHNTTATYVKRIYSKLDVTTRAQATLLAVQLGLVSGR